jgi:hypothetical protein
MAAVCSPSMIPATMRCRLPAEWLPDLAIFSAIAISENAKCKVQSAKCKMCRVIRRRKSLASDNAR